MALDNKYKNPEKYKGKIKIRNLDPEVIGLINSHGGSGGGYDDTLIRHDLEEVQSTLQDHDKLINNINNKISSAATKIELNNYRRKDIDITFNDLDANLKDKINSIGSGGSGSGSTDLSSINNKIQELTSKVTINTGNITSNKDNLNTLTNLFNSFKSEIITSQQQQDTLISSNTNRIKQLENNYSDSSHIGIDRLDPELSNKINQFDNISNSLNNLEQQLNIHNVSINNIKSDLEQTHNDFNTLKDNLSNKLKEINNKIKTNESSINDVSTELHSLTIDKIISFTSTPENIDNGKIKESNLTTELAKKINNVSNMSNDLDEIKNSILHLGLNVGGTNNQFVYKENDDLITKSIFSFINIASTQEEIDLLKSEYKSPIYDKTNNVIFTKVAIEGSADYRWEQLENGLNNNQLVNTYLFDSNTGLFYFNSNGSLINILSAQDFSRGISIKDWFFSADIPNTLQLQYKNEVFQEWHVDDTSAASVSLFNEDDSNISTDNQKQIDITEIIYSINPLDSIFIEMDEYNKLISKTLILDDISGLYIENNGSIKVAHISDGIKLFNTTDKEIIVKILKG